MSEAPKKSQSEKPELIPSWDDLDDTKEEIIKDFGRGGIRIIDTIYNKWQFGFQEAKKPNGLRMDILYKYKKKLKPNQRLQLIQIISHRIGNYYMDSLINYSKNDIVRLVDKNKDKSILLVGPEPLFPPFETKEGQQWFVAKQAQHFLNPFVRSTKKQIKNYFDTDTRFDADSQGKLLNDLRIGSNRIKVTLFQTILWGRKNLYLHPSLFQDSKDYEYLLNLFEERKKTSYDASHLHPENKRDFQEIEVDIDKMIMPLLKYQHSLNHEINYEMAAVVIDSTKPMALNLIESLKWSFESTISNIGWRITEAKRGPVSSTFEYTLKAWMNKLELSSRYKDLGMFNTKEFNLNPLLYRFNIPTLE